VILEVIEGVPNDAGLLQYVMHVLSTESISGLPPGGGINAKRDTIEEILSRLRPQKPDQE